MTLHLYKSKKKHNKVGAPAEIQQLLEKQQSGL